LIIEVKRGDSMILTKEQINRYMRHIIMPEISGRGQKKLLESTALIYGENVKDTSTLIYYLAASGIGHIFCYFEDDNNYEKLFYNIQDLNTDISIKLINEPSLKEMNDAVSSGNSEGIFRVFIGSIGFIERITNSLINGNIFIPTIIALKNHWRGILQTFNNTEEFNFFISSLSGKAPVKDSNDSIISANLLGTLCCIEGVKCCINIGEICNNFLYFDLLSMEFSKGSLYDLNVYLENLTKFEYDNLTQITSNGKNLSECKVLIVGTGGLGCPAAFALSLAGIGTIGLVDYDTVEISNLNRQILHSISRIGMPKVKSAEIFLRKINPYINIVTYNTRLNKDNAMEILNSFDIIVSAFDNLSARYLLNDACFFLRKPMVEAGVLRFNGLSTTIIPGEGHCYRCIFPEGPQVGSIPSCAESGVLGPVPGAMGFIEAAEVIKLATGRGNTLKNRLLFFDAIELNFSTAISNKNLNCPLCGEHPSIDTLQEYEFICESNNLH